MTDVDGSHDLNELERNEDLTAVALPTRVVDRVDDRVAKTDFADASEYVAYVLEHVLAKVEADNERSRRSVDGDEVEERLESLGYLD